MEYLGAVSGLNQTAFEEESEIMAQLLGDYSFSGEHQHELNFGMQPMFWPDDDDRDLNLCSYSWSQESYLLTDNNVALSASSEEQQAGLLHQFEEPSKCSKRKFEETPCESYKEKPHVTTKIQKNAKRTQTKKQETIGEDGKSTECCSSEDDPNAAVNTNGKTRAGRGSATDPQSLYARKRRERINERLRILQNLVPNGTKVDITTMLEEAVQYVKFLQLQIKLLSSDELWMYAPIAYNGVNIDLNISPPEQ